MSISREIKIRLLSKHQKLSNFIRDFTGGFISLAGQDGKIVSIAVNDEDNFNYQVFERVEEVNDILDKRERNKDLNAINLWNKELDESINLMIYPLESSDTEYSKQYELLLSLGIGKRIKGAERFTDYSYYLNNLLPKLTSINCLVCEIECHDYDC